VSFERGVPPIPEISLFDEFASDEDTADEQDGDASLDDAVAAAETGRLRSGYRLGRRYGGETVEMDE
jgi:hypothetical protein